MQPKNKIHFFKTLTDGKNALAIEVNLRLKFGLNWCCLHSIVLRLADCRGGNTFFLMAMEISSGIS